MRDEAAHARPRRRNIMPCGRLFISGSRVSPMRSTSETRARLSLMAESEI
jgi:hypothetical protein